MRSRKKFVNVPVILQPRIGMKYCDWVIHVPISETENRLRKLVFECYDIEDTCDKKDCLILFEAIFYVVKKSWSPGVCCQNEIKNVNITPYSDTGPIPEM